MSAFEITSWIACLITATFVVATVRRRPYCLVKPSFIIGFLMHIQIQWSATIHSVLIESYLPNPWTFWILTHGLIAAVLVLSRMMPSMTARQTFSKARRSAVYASGIHAAIGGLSVAFILIAGVYLYYRPLTSTGLYAIIFEPSIAEAAREESLKLLDNQALKYALVFIVHVIGPLLIVLLTATAVHSYSMHRFVRMLGAVFASLVVLGGVSLPGQRSYAVLSLIAVCYVWALKRSFRIDPVRVAIVLVILFAIPTALTIAREGKSFTRVTYESYFVDGIMDRAFNSPMITALWHIHYAQTVGFFGVGAVLKLAPLVGAEPINAANVIGKSYAGVKLDTQYANTSFVFSYYSYFGPLSIPLSLVLLMSTDLVLPLYSRLRSSFLLLPCIAVTSMTTLAFVSSDFTTVLFSHGFVLTPIVCIITSRLCARPARRWRFAPAIADGCAAR